MGSLLTLGPHLLIFCRQWLTKISTLLGDKAPDIKRRAEKAVRAAYMNVDPTFVADFAENLQGPAGVSMFTKVPGPCAGLLIP